MAKRRIKGGARLRDVAAAAGVSNATVSAVVNGRAGRYGICRTTQEKVQAAVRQLGYTPSLAALDMVSGRNSLVGLALSPEFPGGGRLIAVLEPALAQAGYRLIVICLPSDDQVAAARITDLIRFGIAGLVLFPARAISLPKHYCPIVMAGKAGVGLPSNYDQAAVAELGQTTARRLQQAIRDVRLEPITIEDPPMSGANGSTRLPVPEPGAATPPVAVKPIPPSVPSANPVPVTAPRPVPAAPPDPVPAPQAPRPATPIAPVSVTEIPALEAKSEPPVKPSETFQMPRDPVSDHVEPTQENNPESPVAEPIQATPEPPPEPALEASQPAMGPEPSPTVEPEPIVPDEPPPAVKPEPVPEPEPTPEPREPEAPPAAEAPVTPEPAPAPREPEPVPAVEPPAEVAPIPEPAPVQVMPEPAAAEPVVPEPTGDTVPPTEAEPTPVSPV